MSAELFAISRALKFAKDTNKPAVIFTDNTSSLSLISQYIPPSYKSITQEIHETLLALPAEQVELHWVPGHSHIHGNEVADDEAKKGANGTLPPTAYPADFLEIKSKIKEAAKSHWKRTWETNKTKYHLGNIVSQPLVQHSIQNSSRKLEVLFAQLRLGSSKLNAALFKIRQVDSPLCSVCLVSETPSHYLLECIRFKNEREVLERELNKLNIYALSLQVLLSNPRTLKLTELFITSTKRFE